jgi:hypothetical protein
MTVSSDRWTCPHPECPYPVLVVVGSGPDTHEAIKAVQTRHAVAHRRARDVLADCGLADHDDLSRARRGGRNHSRSSS